MMQSDRKFHFSQFLAKLVGTEKQLRQSHDDFEQRVSARTQELDDERKRAEEAMSESEVRLRTALNIMTDSIYIMDKDHNFVLINDRYREFFDLSPEVLQIGAPVSGAIRELVVRGDYGDGDVEEILADRMANIIGDQVVHVEMSVKNGERIIDVRKAPIEGGGAVAVATDVTDRRRTEAALRESEEALRQSEEHLKVQVLELTDREERMAAQARDMVELAENLKVAHDELAELNNQKDKFFSIIAHDLRGPFNALLGFSSLLAGGIKNFDQDQLVEYSSAVHDSAQQVFKLLENLLEWSRLQMRQEQIEFGPVDLNKIIDTNVELFLPTAQEKNIQLTSTLKQALIACAYAPMVETVVRNLVNNAIKFTSENGEITISARKNGEWVEVEVSDTGVGIPTDKLPRLFRLDEKNSTAGTRGEVGTGLGLPLCKELIETQGGQIDLKSTEGKGSTFRITLPLYQQ